MGVDHAFTQQRSKSRLLTLFLLFSFLIDPVLLPVEVSFLPIEFLSPGSFQLLEVML